MRRSICSEILTTFWSAVSTAYANWALVYFACQPPPHWWRQPDNTHIFSLPIASNNRASVWNDQPLEPKTDQRLVAHSFITCENQILARGYLQNVSLPSANQAALQAGLAGTTYVRQTRTQDPLRQWCRRVRPGVCLRWFRIYYWTEWVATEAHMPV